MKLRWNYAVLIILLTIVNSGAVFAADEGYELPGLFYTRIFGQPTFPISNYTYKGKGAPDGFDPIHGDFKIENEVETFSFKDIKFEGMHVAIYGCEIRLTYNNVKFKTLVGESTEEKPAFRLDKKSDPSLNIPYVMAGAKFQFHYDSQGRPVWTEEDRVANMNLMSAKIDEQTTPEALGRQFSFIEEHVNEAFKLTYTKAWIDSRHPLLLRKAGDHLRNLLKREEILNRLFKEAFQYFPAPPLYGLPAFAMTLEYLAFPKSIFGKDYVLAEGENAVMPSWQVRPSNIGLSLPADAGEPITPALVKASRPNMSKGENNRVPENRALVFLDEVAMNAIADRYVKSIDQKYSEKGAGSDLEGGVRFEGHSIILNVQEEVLKGSLAQLDITFKNRLADGSQYVASIPTLGDFKVAYSLPHLGGTTRLNLNLNIALKRKNDLNAKGDLAEFQFSYELGSDGHIMPTNEIRLITPTERNAALINPKLNSGSAMNEALIFFVVKTFINSTPLQLKVAREARRDERGFWKGTALIGLEGRGPEAAANWKFLNLTFRVGTLSDAIIDQKKVSIMPPVGPQISVNLYP